MKRRAMRLLAIAMTRHTLELSPEFATKMTIGANVPPSDPAMCL
jgi:hypothetical protein